MSTWENIVNDTMISSAISRNNTMVDDYIAQMKRCKLLTKLKKYSKMYGEIKYRLLNEADRTK